MDQNTALPARPDELTKMTQANSLAAIVPQIMNAIGGGDHRTQQLLAQQQQSNEVMLEKQKEQMFMRSIMSPSTGEITPDLIMKNAALFGIPEGKAMEKFIKFDAFRKAKKAEKTQAAATTIGMELVRDPAKFKAFLDGVALPGMDQYSNEEVFGGAKIASEFNSSLPKPQLAESYNTDGTASFVEKKVGATFNPKPKEESLQRVPDGKGGFKFVKPVEGMTGMENPKKGMRIVTNPDGSTTIETEVSGGSEPTKTTTSNLQKDLLEANSVYSDLKNTMMKYDDSFLMGKDKLGFNIDAFKEKWDLGKVSEPEKAKLAEYTAFKRDSIATLNNYIKQITGAAMSVQEAGRLIKGMPNPGTGMFDGDSPTEFKSKMNGTMQQLDRVIARNNYVLRNGLKSVSAVPLGSMGSIIDKRGEEIEAEMKITYPDKSQKEIESMTAGALSKEFGIRF